MSDTPIEDPPAEEPPAPEIGQPGEVAWPPPPPPEAPPARLLVLTRVRYEDDDGNEFFCGPGETIPGEYADQVDADSIEAV